MKNSLPAIHATLAALWLGCVLTEALVERALLSKGKDARLILVHLHVRIDQWVELPAIAGVFLSGLLMLGTAGQSGLAWHVMLSAGAFAMLANLYCVWLVFKRRDAALADDWDRFDQLDHRQHKFGAVVLAGLLVALVAGFVGRG